MTNGRTVEGVEVTSSGEVKVKENYVPGVEHD
jgi:hypothetical protein